LPRQKARRNEACCREEASADCERTIKNSVEGARGFPMDQSWRIEMLGWLRIVQPDRVVSRFRTRKAGALLAYLAYHHQRSHPREQLVDLLWPGCALAAGQRNLRTELASLRRQLEPPGVP